MKPLSERLKDFPTSQFVDWLCLACVDVREVRTPDDAQEEINKIREAVAERLVALEQRAEAAEAKLAELEKQEPVAYSWRSFKRAQLTRTMPESWKQPSDIKPLFTRPAPAINLAELVPDEMAEFPDKETMKRYFNWSDKDDREVFSTGWNACIAEIMRKIEESK